MILLSYPSAFSPFNHYFVLPQGMKIVKKDDSAVAPVIVAVKTAAQCTATTGAPCYVKSVAGKFLVEPLLCGN